MNQDAAKILKEAREKKGWTQDEIAGRLKVTLRQYSKYEQGEFPKYKRDVAREIDKLLGTKLYALIYEQSVPRGASDSNGDLNTEDIDWMRLYLGVQGKYDGLLEGSIDDIRINLERALTNQAVLDARLFAVEKMISQILAKVLNKKLEDVHIERGRSVAERLEKTLKMGNLLTTDIS